MAAKDEYWDMQNHAISNLSNDINGHNPLIVLFGATLHRVKFCGYIMHVAWDWHIFHIKAMPIIITSAMAP
jgi:hypothetical protein